MARNIAPDELNKCSISLRNQPSLYDFLVFLSQIGSGVMSEHNLALSACFVKAISESRGLGQPSQRMVTLGPAITRS